MAGPRAKYLGELLGATFPRLVLVAATLVAMWAFWHGFYVPAVGLALALGYFYYLLWRYSTAGNDREP